MKLVSMYRTLCLTAFTIAIMGCSRAQQPPKMIIDSLEKDVGTIWQGEPAQFDFVVKNEGGSDLTLQAKPGCGCTVAKCDPKVPPGQQGHVVATLNTEHYTTRVTKIVYVYSNDPDKKEVMLKITADVKPYVEVQPQYRPYFYIYKGDQESFAYSLFANDNTPLEIKSVKPSLAYIRTKLTPPTRDTLGKPTYHLEVTIPPDAPVGNVNANVDIETNHPKAQTVHINLIGMIQKEITLSPTFVHFGSLKPGDKNQISVKVSKRKGTFKIISVTSDNDHVTVDVTTQSPGSQNQLLIENDRGPRAVESPPGTAVTIQYQLLLKYDGGWTKGNVNGKVTIVTDDPDQQQLILPFACYIN